MLVDVVLGSGRNCNPCLAGTWSSQVGAISPEAQQGEQTDWSVSLYEVCHPFFENPGKSFFFSFGGSFGSF